MEVPAVERKNQNEESMEREPAVIGLPLPYSFFFQPIHYDFVIQYIAGRARACRAAISKKRNRLYLVLPEDQGSPMRKSQELPSQGANLGN